MNLFPKQTIPYIICAPSYTTRSSGVRMIHMLCHLLNESGQRAYIQPANFAGPADTYATNPTLNTPLIWDHPQVLAYMNDEHIAPIAVYPDTVQGNPLNTRRVVRWRMEPPGAYRPESVFAATDNVWGTTPAYARKVLYLPVSDPAIFFPPAIPNRSGECYYSHKYDRIFHNALPGSTSAQTRLEGSLDQIASILRRSTVCHLYELSSIIVEAALCGCPVELMRSSFFNSIDPEMVGTIGNTVWDDGEVVREINFPFQSSYVMNIAKANLDLGQFISDTQGMP